MRTGSISILGPRRIHAVPTAKRVLYQPGSDFAQGVAASASERTADFRPTRWRSWPQEECRFLGGSRLRSAATVCLLAMAMIVAVASALRAQTPPQQLGPRIGYVYPAGGQQGTTFKVTVGGQTLNGVNGVMISGAGVQARVVDFDRPLTAKEFTELREQGQKLMEKRAAAQKSDAAGTAAAPGPALTPDEQKTLAEFRMQMAKRAARQANPAIGETVTIEVTLAPDATPDPRELRLETPAGLSNPLVFCVGQLPEFGEPAAITTVADRFRPGRTPDRANRRPLAELAITLPAVVNGQILPGEAHRIRFTAHKGQRLVFAMSARALIPFLADAVPGWFQATLTLFDAKGNEMAGNGEFRISPDPVLAYEVPADGEFICEIRDSIYRGRDDFVYRLAVGELPFITGIFPLGGRVGEQATVELTGWNLPANQLAVDAKDKEPGTVLLSTRKDALFSNTVPFALDTLPECREHEPNDAIENAQPLALPVIVNGRIDEAGDWDVFRFEGRAGEDIVAEVFARRLNSPLDSVLKLTDASGRQLAFNDDHEDKGSGLTTHHADSRIGFKLPADGTYYVWLGDAQHHGGPGFGYRLHLGPPRPTFALRVVPSSINVRGGASVPLTVYALRQDGFTGEIALGLKNWAAPLALSGARIPANQDKIRLTLTARATADKGVFDLDLVGRAAIGGRSFVCAAVPAEDMMQAFAYRHLVPSAEGKVAIIGRGPGLGIVERTPVRIPAGGTARLRIRIVVQAGRFPDGLQLELSEPPDGIALQSPSAERGDTDVVLTCDAAKQKPGVQGNLILLAYGERSRQLENGKPAGERQRTLLGAFPAIPFEITAP